MALSQQKRGEVARQLIAEDPSLDEAIALTMVDEMDANGAFTDITNEAGSSDFYSSLPEEEEAPADFYAELPEEVETVDFYAELPEEGAVDTTGWQEVEEEVEEEAPRAPMAPMPNSPSPLSQTTQAPTSFADGGLEAGLDSSIRPDTEASEQELKQYEFEQRHKARAAELRAPLNTLLDLFSIDDKDEAYFGSRDDKNKELLGEQPSQWADASQAGAAEAEVKSTNMEGVQHPQQAQAQGVTIKDVVDQEREAGVYQHWENLVEANARKLYMADKTLTIEAARQKAYDEHMGNVVEGSINFASLFIPGVAPARWAYQFARMSFAAKTAALVSAGVAENVAAGVAGNLTAGRPWDEGIKSDAAWGAGGAGAAAIIGGGVDAYRGYRRTQTADVVETLLDEKATRTMARDQFQGAAELKEAVVDIAKDVNKAKPKQVEKAANSLPEGELKDRMTDLSEGMKAMADSNNTRQWARALPNEAPTPPRQGDLFEEAGTTSRPSEVKEMLEALNARPNVLNPAAAAQTEAKRETARKFFEKPENLSALYSETRNTLRALPDDMDNAVTREMLTKNLEAMGKMGHSRKFFREEDNIRRVKDVVNDKVYDAGKILDETSSEYTALARIMEEGAGAKAAVDTSYLDKGMVAGAGRWLEGKLGAGIPAKIRSSVFNKAQDQVRGKARDVILKRVDDLTSELADDTLKGSVRKGKRHELNELRRVADALDNGKTVKAETYAKAWPHLPKEVRTELDNIQALQQYSKATKAKETPAIIDAPTAAVGHVAAGVAFGTWGAQLAASVTIPALRTLSQVGRKRAIMKANDIVKRNDGDIAKIMEEVNTLKADEQRVVMALLLYRLEAATSAPVEFEEVVDPLLDSAAAAAWQE